VRRFLILSLAFATFECRAKSEHPAVPPVAVASASASASVGGACRAISLNPFSIATAGSARPPASDPDAGSEEDEEDPLPYSVELGAARPFEAGFVVSGLRTEKGAAHAFVALYGEGGGKLVDLGSVHGDPEPPQPVVLGGRLFVLVLDSDAAGRVLRVVEIEEPGNRANVVTKGELSGMGRDATGFRAEESEGRALFVYGAAAKTNAVFAGSFDPAGRKPLSARRLSLGTEDTSEPRLAARPGGFWLAFVSEPAPERAPKSSPKNADAGDDEPEALLELGPRQVRAVPLDGSGTPLGAPRALTAPSTKPFVFDLASDGESGALVLWQESQGAPGAGGGSIRLFRVGADQSVTESRIDDERLGAGAPALLRDPKPPSPAGALWLSAAAEDDVTLFSSLSFGEPPSLSADPIVKGSPLLAVSHGKFLVSHWRGQNVELGLVACPPKPGEAAR
jgi:hypothetical protein